MKTETSYKNGRLIVTRIFNAPREEVFSAWIETSKVQLWWGCGYAEKVDSEIEPRLGGKFFHRMMLRGVGEYLHHGLITEYEPPAILAYRMVNADASVDVDDAMTVRVEFIEEGSGTKVRLTQEKLIDAHSEYVRAGWSAAFEKLATLLAEKFVVT